MLSQSNTREWFVDPEVKPHAVKKSTFATGSIFIINHAGLEYMCEAVNGHIKISKTVDGKLFKTLKGHSGSIHSVIQLTDNQLLSCSSDSTIKLWDIPSGTCTKTYACDENDAVTRLLKLSDESFLSVSNQGNLQHWNTSSLDALSTLSCDEKSYSQIKLKNGLVLIGLYDCIKVFDVANNKFINEFKIHKRPTYALLELNEDFMLSGSADNTIKLWDTSHGLCLDTWTGHASIVTSLIKLNDGRILSASLDETLKLWDKDTGICLKTMGGISSPVVSLHQCNDGLIVGGLLKGNINMWDVGSRSRLCVSTETHAPQSTQLVLSALQTTNTAAAITKTSDAKDDEKFAPAPAKPLFVNTTLIQPEALGGKNPKEEKHALDNTENQQQRVAVFK